MCFSLHSLHSWGSVKNWLIDAADCAPSGLVVVLVGINCDLPWLVNEEEVEVCEKQLMYVECSAKTGESA